MSGRVTRRAALMGSAAAFLAGCVASPGAPTRRTVRGATADIEILTDRLGVPHVRARTIADAYFGDGYVAARDHLWQLDFDHRQGLGRLAEVWGPSLVECDTANRLFLYRGDVGAELAALDPRVRGCAEAYVAGVNAFVSETENRPDLLPVVFSALGYRPLSWKIEDLIRLRAEATGNTRAEIRRARLAARGALEMDALIQPLQPAWKLRVPGGLDVHAVRPEDLGLFAVLQKGPPFGAALGRPVRRRRNEGSNAWVIAPSRTATGRPILANDPHLGFGIPGPRHVVHLSAPGLDVIGGGLPGMPGVMQGHNDRIAFGRTNFHIDQEDLFVLKTDPLRPTHYRHGGAWVPMTEITETIAVRDAPSRSVTLRYAAQGPVVSEEPHKGRAVAVAATWLHAGANGLLANIGINLARDWDEFRQALKLHTSPTNFVYADVDGHIGWQAAGGLPARAEGHDGLLPAPGDGRYDWRGLQTLDDLPHVVDPACGWFGTSNQMNLPEGYDQERRRVSFEWSPPYRYHRVSEWLTENARSTVRDSAALQHDTLSKFGRSLAVLMPDLPGYEAEIARLRQWDGDVRADSAAAALYEVWWSKLRVALHEHVVPKALRDLVPELDVTVIEALLKAPDRRLGAQPVAVRDALMRQALMAAREELARRLGPDSATWRWGALHSVTVRSPLARVPGMADLFPPVGGRGMPAAGTPIRSWRAGMTLPARCRTRTRRRAGPAI